MSIDLAKLKSLPREELVEIARQSGVRVHWKAKPETIVEQIITKVMQPVPQIKQDDAGPAALQPKAEEYSNTPAQVEEAIAKVKARQPRLRSIYNEEDSTFHFQWVSDNGRVMCEECGTLKQKLRVIVNIANKVAMGPIMLRGHSATSFDPGNATGLSAYTNVVMA